MVGLSPKPPGGRDLRSRRVSLRVAEKKHDPFASVKFSEIGVRSGGADAAASGPLTLAAASLMPGSRKVSVSPRASTGQVSPRNRARGSRRGSNIAGPQRRESKLDIQKASRSSSRVPSINESVMVESLKRELELHTNLLKRKTDEVAMVRQREHMTRTKYQQKIDQLQEEILRLLAGEDPEVDLAARAREEVLQRCLDMATVELKETQDKLEAAHGEISKLQAQRDLFKHVFVKLKQFVCGLAEVRYLLESLNVGEMVNGMRSFMMSSIVKLVQLVPAPPIAAPHVYPLLVHGHALRSLAHTFTGVLLEEPNLLDEPPSHLYEPLPGSDPAQDPARDEGTQTFYTDIAAPRPAAASPKRSDASGDPAMFDDPSQIDVPSLVAGGNPDWRAARVARYTEDFGFGVGGLDCVVTRLQALEIWWLDERERREEALRDRLENSKEVQTEEDIYKKLYEETLAKLKECEAEKERVEAELKQLQVDFEVLEGELEEQRALNAKSAAEIDFLTQRNEELETQWASASEELSQLKESAAELMAKAEAAEKEADLEGVHEGPATLTQILRRTIGRPLTQSLVTALRDAVPKAGDGEDGTAMAEDAEIWEVVHRTLGMIAEQGFAPEFKTLAKEGEGLPEYPEHIQQRMVFCHRCASGPYGQPEKYCVYCHAVLYYGLVGTIPLGKRSEEYWKENVEKYLDRKKQATLVKKRRKDAEEAGEPLPDDPGAVPKPEAPPAMVKMEDVRRERAEQAVREREAVQPGSPTCVTPVMQSLHPAARLVTPQGAMVDHPTPYLPALPRGMYGDAAGDSYPGQHYRAGVGAYIRPISFVPSIDPYNVRTNNMLRIDALVEGRAIQPQPQLDAPEAAPLPFYIGDRPLTGEAAIGTAELPQMPPSQQLWRPQIGGAFAKRAQSAGPPGRQQAQQVFASTLGAPAASVQDAAAAVHAKTFTAGHDPLEVHGAPAGADGTLKAANASRTHTSRDRVFLHMLAEPGELHAAAPLPPPPQPLTDPVAYMQRWFPKGDQYARGYRKAKVLLEEERAAAIAAMRLGPVGDAPASTSPTAAQAKGMRPQTARGGAGGGSPTATPGSPGTAALNTQRAPQSVVYGRAPLVGGATEQMMEAPCPPPPRGVKGVSAQQLWSSSGNMQPADAGAAQEPGGAPTAAAAADADAAPPAGTAEPPTARSASAAPSTVVSVAAGDLEARGYATRVRLGGEEPVEDADDDDGDGELPTVVYAPARRVDGTATAHPHESWVPGADMPIAAASGLYVSEPYRGHIHVAVPRNRPSSSRLRQNLKTVPDLRTMEQRVQGQVPLPHEWHAYTTGGR